MHRVKLDTDRRPVDPAVFDHKWRTVLLLSLAELLAMGLWFSASAVTPTLADIWGLNGGQVAWLSMAVTVGFVAGAVLSALTNLADIYPPRYVFFISAMIGAAATALISLSSGFLAAVVLRLVTGFVLAGVYPVGMKIMATWMKEDRGLGIGLLTGALAIGTASPHLIRALGGINNWQFVLYVAATLAAVGGLIALWIGELGPYRSAPAMFNWRYATDILRDRGLRLANFGYLGHMWELFSMWTWISLFLLASYQAAGSEKLLGMSAETAASLMTFLAIAASGPSSLLAGWLADRLGRTRITIVSLAVSGSCAVLIGFLFGLNPWLVSLLALVWGFAIAPDSAQYSTAVSELSDPKYMGTALTLQTSMGFLLTLITVRLVPTLVDNIGWRWAFAILALGPIFGIWAMRRLQRSPDAARLAGGRG
ncbi:MAG: MFS transporter [Candidatus Promineifilaceae bacterium]